MIGSSTTPSTRVGSRGGRCGYPRPDRLRAPRPAVAVELPGGFPAWLVTRGDVARTPLPSPGAARDVETHVPDHGTGRVTWLSPWVDVAARSTAEGREHQRLRKLVSPALTPRRIDAMRPHLEAIAATLLDDLERRFDGEPPDLHTAYSRQLPARMVCDLFGVPDELRPEVLRILRVVFDNRPGEESAVAYADMHVAVRALIELKRRAPADDLTSFVIAARVGNEAPLGEQDLVGMLLLLIGGDTRTAVSLIDHTVRELLADPDQLPTVLADPRRWTGAVEEALRVHRPVSSLPMRWATEDIDLGAGVVIRAGDAILIDDLAHATSGAGPHFCPGARLARLEAHVAVPALFERFPDLALAAPQDVRPIRSSTAGDFTTGDVAALPVLLRQRAARAA